MLGFAFDNLSRRVTKTVDQWLTQQSVSRNLDATRRRRLGSLVGRPFACVSALVVLKLIIALLWWASPRFLALAVPSYDWSNAEFAAYFGTLWSVQATIAALVYPIVIAFVAVLLQRRATAKLSLQLYLRDAAALAAGISSIALVATMGIEYLAVPYAPPEWLAMGAAGDCTWFFINVALTAWFLYRTVRYLDDSNRMLVFTHYAASVALPADIRERLEGNMFLQDGHVEESQGDKETASNKPRVRYLPFHDGKPCVSIAIGGSKTIVDVRLRLLRWAAQLWTRANDEKHSVNAQAASRTGAPLLSITFGPGETLSGEETLCTVRGGNPPGFVPAFLIRHSLVLGHKKPAISTINIFEELSTEVLPLLEQRRFEAATETISALVDLHAELIKAGAFVTDTGAKDNAALLADAYQMVGLRLHQEWVRGYRELIIAAATDDNLKTAFYDRCCYLPYRLLNRLRDQHPDIISYVLNLSSLLSHRLGLWWQSKAEDKGLTTGSAANAVVLSLPASRQYDSAMKTFIEGWEAASYLDIRLSQNDADDAWRRLSEQLQFAAEYLRYLLKMFSGAVVRGDRVAALYLMDSLLKWWASQETQFDGHPLPAQDFPVHTIACVDDEWSVVRSSIENLPEGDEELPVAQALASIVLRRFWVDIRCVAALVLLSWTQTTADESAFSFELAVALLTGRSYVEGGTVALRAISEFHRVWLHLVRGQVADRRYASRLNGIVRAMHETIEPDRLGGRVFSGFGDADMDSLLNTQIELLLAVAGGRTPFGVFTAVSAVPHWSRDMNQLEQLRQFVSQLGDALNSPGLAQRLPLVERLRTALGNPTNADDARTALTNELNALATAATEARLALFANARVAESRLRLASSAVSQYVLDRKCKTFPLSVAGTFIAEPRSSDVSRANVINVRKGPFTDPPLESGHDRSIEWYNKLVGEQIALSVLEKYLRANDTASLPNASTDIFLDELEKRAQGIQLEGGTPAILVPLQNAPAWLRQLREGPGEAADSFAFSYRRANDAASVIGHLGDVPIHAAPISIEACHLVPLGDFAKLTYAAFDDATCVGIEWSPESDETIRLSFFWNFSVPERD
ncbi:Uncharacterised protein [Burkholderia pseudomallei]|nr:Uncharacterised protein [Burkholderia pseudomallei]